MTLPIGLVIGVTLLYILLLFAVAYYAYRQRQAGRSVIANATAYSLSIAVYATSWTFYGSVGIAATNGIEYLFTYLGPSLIAFSWWFLLRKIVRISKENNITSIADFISSRYGKSQWLGALITVIAILGIMPYIALQLKAISSTFGIITGHHDPLLQNNTIGNHPFIQPGFFAALFLSIFSVIFGARQLVSSERHEGLVAAVVVETVVKLVTFLSVGIFVTYVMFDGITDIFSRMMERNPDLLFHLTTFGGPGETSFPKVWTSLLLSTGAIMLLPRQFHIMVIENSREEHIRDAMWRFPAYLFLINLFVMPIALGGILTTGGNAGADYFVLTLPLSAGHRWLALIAFLGGFSASAGMVMVESVAISTMFLNHLFMPIIVKLKPRSWFPVLLINLKRFGIFLVIFLGYFYEQAVGTTYMLVNMGLISFSAAAQFGPALVGGLYWHRGNKAGAISGILLGFLLWFYTLLIPSFVKSGWWQSSLLDQGPFGIDLLKPTALFGLSGLDIWSHSLFWSLFFNIGGYLVCSIILGQSEREKEQVRKFVDVFETPDNGDSWETKRLSKPITIVQFTNLMSKFIGEPQAYAAISEYMGNREIDEKGGVSEFELPKLKRFIEKTLAGSVGAAAAGAIVESYLSDLGTKMESVYDIFSTVRSSLAESREALYVRLRASEIMNRAVSLQIIMDDLLALIQQEFKFDLVVIRLTDRHGVLTVQAFRGIPGSTIAETDWLPDVDTYIGEAYLSNRPQFVNDTLNITKPRSREILEAEGIRSFAHIPIASQGEHPLGILSVFSRSIVGLFTEPFLKLLSSLAGQLAQVVKIEAEQEARELERRQKEAAQLENALVTRDMELAKQIQLSLLPERPPTIKGVRIACRCVTAAHVGGDYYDFFSRDEQDLEVIIADVSGHSVGAALIMAETRTALRAQPHPAASSGSILSALNELLHDDLSRAELFITMFYVKFNAETKMLSYASAGHNPPLLHRRSENGCRELDAEGLILGVRQQVAFEDREIELASGDMLLLYTDGIVEAQNGDGELFGTGRLCSFLETLQETDPEQAIDAILKEVMRFSGSTAFQDDVSLVIMRIL